MSKTDSSNPRTFSWMATSGRVCKTSTTHKTTKKFEELISPYVSQHGSKAGKANHLCARQHEAEDKSSNVAHNSLVQV